MSATENTKASFLAHALIMVKVVEHEVFLTQAARPLRVAPVHELIPSFGVGNFGAHIWHALAST